MPDHPAAASLLFAIVATLPAQSGIRLTSVPELVVLPAAEGRNLLVEATTPAGVKAAWLSTKADGVREVDLRSVGDQRWQINLGDARVFDLVRRTGERSGHLFVCAEIGGRVGASEPIAWSRPTLPDTPPRCLLHRPDQTQVQAVFFDQRAWVDVETLERLEIAGVTRPASRFAARMGSTTVPLRPNADRSAWMLDVDAGKRDAWLQAGALEIEERHGDQVTVAFELAAVPHTLELPGGKARVTVKQRKSATVPGSRLGLTVSIDDITAGQTAITVRTATDRVLAGPQSCKDGDELPFELGGGRYAIRVGKLTNLIIGEDFADLEVLVPAVMAVDPIAQLLELVEKAPIRFVREGKDYDGKAAAAHLRTKLAALAKAPTLDQFLDEVASRSSLTGNEYRIRLQDGREVPAKEWLRQQATMLRDR